MHLYRGSMVTCYQAERTLGIRQRNRVAEETKSSPIGPSETATATENRPAEVFGSCTDCTSRGLQEQCDYTSGRERFGMGEPVGKQRRRTRRADLGVERWDNPRGGGCESVGPPTCIEPSDGPRNQ
jgi:hypothetical protein